MLLNRDESMARAMLDLYHTNKDGFAGSSKYNIHLQWHDYTRNKWCFLIYSLQLLKVILKRKPSRVKQTNHQHTLECLVLKTPPLNL